MLSYLLLFLQIIPGPKITAPEIIIRAQSVREEFHYIQNLIRKTPFFNRYGYSVQLPPGKDVQKLKSLALENKLDESLFLPFKKSFEKTIYRKKNYQKGVIRLQKLKKKLEGVYPVFQKYQKLWGFKISPRYSILLTLYGPGGSYHPETGKIVMLTDKEGRLIQRNTPLGSIIHEMVHIGIEEGIIRQYQLSHGVKERIVDQFVKRHFGDLLPGYQMQSVGDPVIDPYLTQKGSWNNLPLMIEQFKQDQLQQEE